MTSRCLTGFRIFWDDVLQHDLVERQIGHEAFELGVFVAELLQLAGLTGLEIAVLLLPAIEALLGNADLSTEIPDGHPLGGLLQHGGDLLDGESLPLHGTPPGPDGPDCAADSLWIWSKKAGAPHE
jgi:hypothetical protein